MPRKPLKRRETFLKRGLRLCWHSICEQHDAIRRWKHNATALSDRCFDWSKERVFAAVDWFSEHRSITVVILPAMASAVVTYGICRVMLSKQMDEGVLFLVGLVLFLGVFCVLAGLALIEGVSVFGGIVLFFLFMVGLGLFLIARAMITCVSLAGTLLCIAWFVLNIFAQFLLLVPLCGLFLMTRAIQLWRGIFYTCPSRRCSYRGLPAYVCPQCGELTNKLWPSLYGLFWHYCARCGHRLPVLDLLGRGQLKRCCGRKDCHMPLLGRHAGRSPERLVAIVGGSDSGKTCYLHMAVNQIVHGNGQVLPIRGMIDDPQQERVFKEAWSRLNSGVVAARKTKEVTHAYILHARVHGRRCQLYLYDAPGEEFSSISSMSRQQYFSLIEGFILLVDPMSFVAVAGPGAGTRTQLGTVVSSTLGTAVAGMMPGPDGRFPQRVAVVISKGDAAVVRDRIGDVRRGAVSGEVCRQAICDWGGEHPVRLIEQRFAQVRCFACSSLGREAGTQSAKPFRGSGLLEPLCWILNACEDRPAQVSLPRSSEKR
jgi:hypothetical protein